MEQMKDLERRFAKCLARFREERRRNPQIRPFFVEFFGLPKSCKTTACDKVAHFLNREEWKVFAPPEGPEEVPVPYGRTPLFNYETFCYSLRQVYSFNESLMEAVLLERAIFDHVTWLEYWKRKGKMDENEQRICEEYALQPRLRDKFDLHLCFVTSPEVSLKREVDNGLSTREGETMNAKSITSLRDIVMTTYERFSAQGGSKLVLVDTAELSIMDAARISAGHVCDAFERRLKSL